MAKDKNEKNGRGKAHNANKAKDNNNKLENKKDNNKDK
ncbi:MAG: hypothetical protein K0Q97_1936 [Bacillota bacterium]|jgi:hypothetical protein|nr:hypothetical protein [Bacillota bacterium]